jgi:hypothetical protein
MEEKKFEEYPWVVAYIDARTWEVIETVHSTSISDFKEKCNE